MRGPGEPAQEAGVTLRDRDRFGKSVVDFYGSSHPRLFEIERRCMDRDGVLLSFLDSRLPDGRVLDVGAGDGFTASRLSRARRAVVALEPDPGMVSRRQPLVWVSGVVQDLPFHDRTFDAAYSTWAFFLSGLDEAELEAGLSEINRVVVGGGPIIIAENAGGDEFCSFSGRPIHGDPGWWRERGFDTHVLESSFRFDDADEARELLTFYFGDGAGERVTCAEVGFNIAVYVGAAAP